MNPCRALLVTALFASGLAVMGWNTPAEAAGTTCPGVHLGNMAPDLDARMLQGARELCRSEYAVVYSPRTRTPLYAAEYLTAERVRAARSTDREDNFREDGELPQGERSTLRDYQRSGFDRGHVAPSGDMSNPRSQEESFLLSNMIPQNPDNNRRIWCTIESTVRDLVMRDGDAYVVTGPLFVGSSFSAIGQNRVVVPTHVYKAVWSQRRGTAGVYVTANADGGTWQAMSLAEFQAVSGVSVFPALPASVRDAAPTIPQPTRPCPGAQPQMGVVLSASSPQAQAPRTSVQEPGAPTAGTGMGAAAMGALRRYMGR